jgi:hypothetical protein
MSKQKPVKIIYKNCVFNIAAPEPPVEFCIGCGKPGVFICDPCKRIAKKAV